jgi:hypothetical protein
MQTPRQTIPRKTIGWEEIKCVSRVGPSKFRLEPTTPEDIVGLLALLPGDEVVTPCHER